MPTYEYQCKFCERKHEAFQSITAAPLRKCPACGRMGLKRLIGAGAGIIFKGSGFFATDYGRGSGSRTSKPSKAHKDAEPGKAAESSPSGGPKKED